MKRNAIVLGVLLLVACAPKSTVKPPERLISPEKMEDVLYDMSLIKAIKNTNFQTEESKAVLTPDYLFEKYAIDSLQWADNLSYYSKNPKQFVAIYKRVEARYPSALDSIDTLLKKENKKITTKK